MQRTCGRTRIPASFATGLLAGALLSAGPALAVNPQDISLAGDLQLGTDFKTPGPPNDRLHLPSLELAYQGYLSPTARADVFLGLHPAEADPAAFGFEPEEVSVTLMDLPGDASLRLGKIRAAFGKLNRFDSDQWLFVSHPLVLERFLGEDGLADFGAEASFRIPNPWDAFVQLNTAVLNGGSQLSTPGAADSGKAGSFRLSGSADVTADSYLEAGLSGLAGPATHSAGLGLNAVGALDLTYRWRPDETTSFTTSGEYLAHQRQLEDGQTSLPTGFYAVADYQFLRQHDVGVRVDQAWSLDPGDRLEQAGSVFYTFSPWESNRYRLQLTHALTYDQGFAAPPVGETRLLAQTLFFLGPHKHAVKF